MYQVRLYDKGYTLYAGRIFSDKKGGGKRGKLTGKVSSASFRRLRKFCITHDVPIVDCWGITLTVPGIELVSANQFRAIHHKLIVFCNNNNIPLVWRVELQQRGQPHLHCVVYASVNSVLKIFVKWYKYLHTLDFVFNSEYIDADHKDLVMVSRAFLQGSEHAVYLERLSGDFRSFRYLVAHMSKSKQSQSGWQGRNWGVCNKFMFSETTPLVEDVDQVVFYSVRRWVRRLTMGPSAKRKGRRANKMLEKIRSVKGKPEKVFYPARKFRTSNCSYWLGNPSLIKSMLDLAVSNPNGLPF